MRYKTDSERQKRVTFSLPPDTISYITEYSQKDDMTMSKYVERSCDLTLAIRCWIAQAHEEGWTAEEFCQMVYEYYCDRFHLNRCGALEPVYEEYRNRHSESDT